MVFSLLKIVKYIIYQNGLWWLYRKIDIILQPWNCLSIQRIALSINNYFIAENYTRHITYITILNAIHTHTRTPHMYDQILSSYVYAYAYMLYFARHIARRHSISVLSINPLQMITTIDFHLPSAIISCNWMNLIVWFSQFINIQQCSYRFLMWRVPLIARLPDWLLALFHLLIYQYAYSYSIHRNKNETTKRSNWQKSIEIRTNRLIE